MQQMIGRLRLAETMLFAGHWIGTRFSEGIAANHIGKIEGEPK